MSEKYNGITDRALNQIFFNATTTPDSSPTSYIISYMEVYCEQVFDLFASTKPEVLLRDDGFGAVTPSNLTETSVSSASEALQLLRAGTSRRQTSATHVHKESSRSHSVLLIRDSRTGARMTLVDLAGSERNKKTTSATPSRRESTDGTERARLLESIKINSGLLALSNVLRQLSTGASGTHVSFRESKLTRLLQSSLMGDVRTLMIACISSSKLDRDESLNTLVYASRAKSISPSLSKGRQLPLMHRIQLQILNQASPGATAGNTDVESDASESRYQTSENEEVQAQKQSFDLEQELSDTRAENEKLRVALSDMENKLTQTIEYVQQLATQFTQRESDRQSLLDSVVDLVECVTNESWDGVTELDDRLRKLVLVTKDEQTQNRLETARISLLSRPVSTTLAYEATIQQNMMNEGETKLSARRRRRQRSILSSSIASKPCSAESDVPSISFQEYLETKRALRDLQKQTSALTSELVETQSELSSLKERIREKDKDVYYYRKVNRDLKVKMREYMESQERSVAVVRELMSDKKRAEQENAQLKALLTETFR